MGRTKGAPQKKVTRPTTIHLNSPVRKRARLSKGLNILPPSESDLKGHLTFTKKKEKDRYKEICHRQIIPCKYVHHSTLETLNIHTKFFELIDNIRWQKYFSITCPAYIELVREFYVTFEFEKPDKFTLSSPGVVQFRLKGKMFKLSITGFNLAFGFITEEFSKSDEYLNSACDFYEEFNPIALYRTMSKDKYYDLSKSKDSYLYDPVLKYIHRFLAFTFSGRKDSAAVLTKAEFYFLWCMQNRIKVNLGCWLASQFANVVMKKRPLILGSLITQLAVHENLLDLNDNNLHVACHMQPLDLHSLEIMGLIRQTQGVFSFCSPGPIAVRPRHTTSDSSDSSESEPPSALEEPIQRRYDEELDNLRQQLTRMEQNQLAFYRHMGFDPPFPLPQQ